jgi:integrase
MNKTKATGSLQIKGGKYYVVARIKLADGGKIPQQWIPTDVSSRGNNKRRAEARKREILTKLEETYDNSATADTTLFVDCVERFIKSKKSSLRINTYESYIQYWNTGVKPFFAKLNLRLGEVSRLHIKRFIDEAYAKGLSAQSIDRYMVVVRGTFKEAVEDGVLNADPSSGVRLPSKQQFKGKAYTQELATELIERAKGSTMEVPITLGLYYGLRRSEVCGLRWQDINLNNDTIHICNTVVRRVTLDEAERTKSKASDRTLYVVPYTKNWFIELRQSQERLRELVGDDSCDTIHLCIMPDGKHMSPDYITRQFHSFLTRQNLPIIRYHDLRHTVGSLLLESGMSIKHVQEYLGHEKVSTTLDIYTHLSMAGKIDTATAVNALYRSKDDG